MSKTVTRWGRAYSPGVNHDHRPCGRWEDVKDANEVGGNLIEIGIWGVAAGSTAKQLVLYTLRNQFDDKPMGKTYLRHYLYGKGVDMIATPMDDLLENIPSFCYKVVNDIKARKFRGWFKVYQADYVSQDWRFALGAVDKMCFEYFPADDEVGIYFMDRYEWHPYFPGFYTVHPGDAKRPTNLLNAALVEMKDDGAQDFWIKGEIKIALSDLTRYSKRSTPVPPNPVSF